MNKVEKKTQQCSNGHLSSMIRARPVFLYETGPGLEPKVKV